MWAGHDVGDDFSILGIGDGGFEDADDGGRTVAHEAAVEPKGFAKDGRIFPEGGRPETIGENGDAGSFGTVVLRSDEPAEDRVKAHDFEKVPAHHASLNYARLTQADQGEFSGRKIAKAAHGFNTGAQILDFRHRES